MGTNEYLCSKCGIIHFCYNPEEWDRIENSNESNAVYKCRICGTEQQPSDPNSTNKPNTIVEGIEGARIWDWHHPDDSEKIPSGQLILIPYRMLSLREKMRPYMQMTNY